MSVTGGRSFGIPNSWHVSSVAYTAIFATNHYRAIG